MASSSAPAGEQVKMSLANLPSFNPANFSQFQKSSRENAKRVLFTRRLDDERKAEAFRDLVALQRFRLRERIEVHPLFVDYPRLPMPPRKPRVLHRG